MRDDKIIGSQRIIKNFLFTTTITLSVTLTIFACSGIIGWYGHIQEFIRYDQNSIGMVFNTALCFLLFAVAIFSIVFNQKIIAWIACFIVLIICSLVLLEFALGVNIGIDELFFHHYDALYNISPGRMAVSTATCFIGLSLACLMLTFEFLKNLFNKIATAICLVVFAFVIVTLCGYLTEVPSTYWWGKQIPMASTAGVGFIILSANLFVICIYFAFKRGISLQTFLPGVISLCFFVTTMVLAIEVGNYEAAFNIDTNMPSIIFIVGSFLTVTSSLLTYFLQAAFINKFAYKKALSALKSILEATTDSIMVMNIEGKVVYYNEKFLKMWRFSKENVAAMTLKQMRQHVAEMLINPAQYYFRHRELAATIDEEYVDIMYLKDQTIVERHIEPQILDGVVIGRVFSYRDITKQKRLEEKLMHMATHDSITGLPNRALLQDLLVKCLDTAKRQNGKVALIILNLDKFSHINDVLGRTHGDEILKVVAKKLRDALSSDYVVGRFGGDEFVVITPTLYKNETILVVIGKLLEVFKQPFNIFDNLVNVSATSGIAMFPKDADQAQMLLSKADMALKRAKITNRSSYQFFTEAMNNYTLQNITLEARLHEAINEESFDVFYQPVFDLEKMIPVGVEALIRWRDKDDNLILPMDFIPLAEELGLIPKIGEIVIKKACKQLQLWSQQGINDVTMAINISAYQFQHKTLLESLRHAIKETSVAPQKIELELTERVFLNSDELVSGTLKELTDMGIMISVDDFGTGYSTFSYIKRFKISKIKIDKSFVQDSVTDEQDQIIVRAMILMAGGLNFDVVAEGIETAEQLELMKKLKCSQGQGYYFSTPMPAAQCTEFLKKYL